MADLWKLSITDKGDPKTGSIALPILNAVTDSNPQHNGVYANNIINVIFLIHQRYII